MALAAINKLLVGTISMSWEQGKYTGEKALGEEFGVDTTRFRVIAIELSMPYLSVSALFAFDKSNIEGSQTIPDFAASRGGNLPVIRFLVNKPFKEIEEWIRDMQIILRSTFSS